MPAPPHKHQSYNDEPVFKCQLDREPWLMNIVQNIYHSTPPKTFAIHGSWGSGKTSQLLQLYWCLGGDISLFGDNCPLPDKGKLQRLGVEKTESPYTKAVWFEAWKYQHEENIVVALLQEIRSQLSNLEKLKKALKTRSKATIKALVESIDTVFIEIGEQLGGAGTVSKATIKSPFTKYKEILSHQRTKDYADPLASMEINSLLQKAVNALLKLNKGITDPWKESKNEKGTNKLIIIIDDLDRCHPEKAFQILETIKVYLNLDNCIFVLGMDQEAIEQIIAQHYEKILKDDNKANLSKMARLYLEKICQQIYHVPSLTVIQKYTFFQKLLGEKEIGLDEDLVEIINNNIQFDEDNGRLATPEFLPPIARSIKVFTNALLLFLNKDTIRTALIAEPAKSKLLLILVYLYAFHYEVYQMIYLYPSFFVTALIPFAEYGVTNDHPILAEIVLPESDVLKSLDGLIEGGLIETTTPDNNDETTEVPAKVTPQKYPFHHLRQVLWVRYLIFDPEVVELANANTLDELSLL